MRVILSTLSNSLLDKSKRMINKVLGFGRDDVKTGFQVITPGVEGRPIDGSKVVFLETSQKGVNVIAGTIEKSQEIEKGEVIIYSRNSNGEVQNTIHFKSNGVIEIGGDTDNMMRFLPLSQSMTTLSVDINIELVAIKAGIASAGGSYTPQPITIDISGAKIDEIKTGS